MEKVEQLEVIKVLENVEVLPILQLFKYKCDPFHEKMIDDKVSMMVKGDKEKAHVEKDNFRHLKGRFDSTS